MAVEETARARQLRVRRDVRSHLAAEIDHLEDGTDFLERWPEAEQATARDELQRQRARLLLIAREQTGGAVTPRGARARPA